MLNSIQYKSNQVGNSVYAASRQVWLAGLGAAVVTRDWAEREAGNVFRTLIKEGTAVESRAFRLVGDQVESSLTRANMLWKKTRSTVETTVRAYADTAVTIVRKSLPKALPKVELPAMLQAAPAPKSSRAKRAVKARTAKTVKRVKRTAKSAKR
ncbi:MAG TPA: phasin family protein [Casimicrobiaceae bacterium]|nr:phasin family protein [Casimicrobiaceae bacterium]